MWSRVRNVFRRDLNDHIDAELPSHFDDAQAAGRDPFEVRRAFGSRLRVREATRDVIVAVWVESLLQDLRQTIRELRRSAVFTATAVLALALGIGATTAVVTLIQQMMLRALPVANPQQLWRVGDAVTCCYSTGVRTAKPGRGSRLGIPASFGAGRLMISQLFGVAPSDPLILSGAPLLLMLAASIATVIPARRAASVDPVQALRAE